MTPRLFTIPSTPKRGDSTYETRKENTSLKMKQRVLEHLVACLDARFGTPMLVENTQKCHNV